MRKTGEEKTCDAHEKEQLSRFSYTYAEEGGVVICLSEKKEHIRSQ